MSSQSPPLAILLLNQTWLADELRSLGHRVVTVGWENSEFDLELKTPGLTIEELWDLLPRGFVADRVVYFDNSGPIGIIGLEKISVPSLFYSVDAHHHHTWHPNLGGAFDAVFVAQKDFLPQFEKFNSNTTWVPLWAPLDLIPEEPKTIDVCFRGNLNAKLHPKRAEFFKALSQLVSVDVRTDYYSAVYPRSKIVLNQAVKGDLNFRVFEAMISGALVITPRIGNGLEELFVSGKELVVYEDGNVEDAAEKIRYFLAHDEERKIIAAEGRKKILKEHLKINRARKLEEVLLSLNVTPRPWKHLGIAVAALVSTRFCRNRLDSLADKMLFLLAESMENHLLNQAQLFSFEVESMALLCKLELEKVGLPERALNLMSTFIQTHNNNIALMMGYIESIQRLNGDEAAIKLCRQISPTPETLLSESVRVMDVIRKAGDINQPLQAFQG